MGSGLTIIDGTPSKFRLDFRRLENGAGVAQLVEHVIRNDGVGGSSPFTGTTLPLLDLSAAGN